MKTKKLGCCTCDKKFDKYYPEYRARWAKGQRRFYCGLSCAMTASNKRPRRRSTAHMDPGNQLTELSPFKWFMARARQRQKAVDIDVIFLKELWDRQEGRCPISGRTLILPETTAGWRTGRRPDNASLDRTDSSRGYLRGNVRFVALLVNLAKSDFADAEVAVFFKGPQS